MVESAGVQIEKILDFFYSYSYAFGYFHLIHLTRPCRTKMPKLPNPPKSVADKSCGVASRRPFYMNNLCLKISMGFPPILQAEKLWII